MADFGIIFDGFLSINGVDLSLKVMEFSADEGIEEPDATAWGVAARVSAPGLKTAGISVTFKQDYAPGSVDATIAPLVANRTTFAVEWRPSDAVVGTSNPKRTGTFYVRSYNPIAGRVGDFNVARVELAPASEVVRATA